MIKKDGLIYVHSAKKFCEQVESIPKDAEFYALHTCAIPAGIILKDERKKYTLYHTHLKGGSDPKKHGKFGKHAVYKAERIC